MDLGEISVFGRDIGRIVLNIGFDCDLKIFFLGRSLLGILFNFLGINIKVLELVFELWYVRLNKILLFLMEYVMKKVFDLIKDLF